MPALGELGHVLTNQSVSGSYTTDTWTCTSVGTTSVYERNSLNNAIQYDSVNGWSDYGGDNPNYFRTGINGTVTSPPADATVLYLYATNSLFAVLNTGYSSGTSGGGTGTEGTSTGTSAVSGTIVDNGTHYTFTVASTAPSSSGVVAYNVLRDDVAYGTITHTNGSTSPMDIHLLDRASSNWKLTIVSTTGLYQSATLATFTNIRKGSFCNFW